MCVVSNIIKISKKPTFYHVNLIKCMYTLNFKLLISNFHPERDHFLVMSLLRFKKKNSHKPPEHHIIIM